MASTSTSSSTSFVSEFYASLDKKETIIHALAATMLKTRYDPTRTNAYSQFSKQREAGASVDASRAHTTGV